MDKKQLAHELALWHKALQYEHCEETKLFIIRKIRELTMLMEGEK